MDVLDYKHWQNVKVLNMGIIFTIIKLGKCRVTDDNIYAISQINFKCL
jgi:hypothetical protein